MKQLEMLVVLLDQAIAAIERGHIEDLLDAQFAIYGVAQGASPVRTEVDESVVRLCEYCLDCLSHGERQQEWAAVQVLSTLRKGMADLLSRGVQAAEVEELVDVSA
jgi:hypothetical protein